MLGITAFEYFDTSIGPYNEIAIAIPIRFPPKFTFPVLAAISMMRKKLFSVYIHHLPVTTEIALKGGIFFWNYPKFLGEIGFKDEGQHLAVTLKEKGEMILKLKARKLPLNRSSGLRFLHHQSEVLSLRMFRLLILEKFCIPLPLSDSSEDHGSLSRVTGGKAPSFHGLSMGETPGPERMRGEQREGAKLPRR